MPNDGSSSAANTSEKKSFVAQAIFAATACFLAGCALALMGVGSGLATAVVLGAFCFWFCCIAVAHALAASLPDTSPAEHVANPVLDPTRGQVIVMEEDENSHSFLPVILTLAAGVLLGTLLLVIAGSLETPLAWGLSWDAALGASTVAGLALFFSFHFCNSEYRLWSVCLRICTMAALCLVIAALVWAWMVRTLDASEPSWAVNVLIVLFFVVVVDSLVAEFLRMLKEPAERYETWGPGSGVWMVFLLNDSQAKLLDASRNEKDILTETGPVFLTAGLRRWSMPVTAAALILFWISTSLTVVPLGYVGVPLNLGKVGNTPLPPGLHMHSPWPFARVALVNTSRIFEERVGFEADLNRPALWDEPHLKGEMLMLTGSGTEFITANIPVFYRVSDAPAFYRAGSSIKSILSKIVLAEWTQEVASGEGIRLIGEDRLASLERVASAAQKRSDELKLGIKIMFLGMRDAHPPVQTARAFQDVISAMEQMRSEIENAEADTSLSLADAQGRSNGILSLSYAEKEQRTFRARSVATPFEAMLRDSTDSIGAIRSIKQFAYLEKSLIGRPLVIISSDVRQGLDFSIDLRDERADRSGRGSKSAGLTSQFSLPELPTNRPIEVMNIDPLPRAEPIWNGGVAEPFFDDDLPE